MVHGYGRLVLRPGRLVARAAWLSLWLSCAGCAPVWHLHYDQAEKAARNQNRPLVPQSCAGSIVEKPAILMGC